MLFPLFYITNKVPIIFAFITKRKWDKHAPERTQLLKQIKDNELLLEYYELALTSFVFEVHTRGKITFNYRKLQVTKPRFLLIIGL